MAIKKVLLLILSLNQQLICTDGAFHIRLKFSNINLEMQFSLQCFDTGGWASGRHPACKKLGVGLLGHSDWSFASLIASVVTNTSITLSSKKARMVTLWYQPT